MKVIMGVSADGYTAKGPHDDMSWTPLLDRQIFRAMTLTGGGKLVMGSNTYKSLVRIGDRIGTNKDIHEATLPNRSKFVATMDSKLRDDINLSGYTDWEAGHADCAMLEWNDAWLIGGQTLVNSCLAQGVVTEVNLAYNDVKLGGGTRDLVSRFLNIDDRWKLVARTKFRADLCMHHWRMERL